METILLVEDEAFVREVTSEVLRSAGYTVVAARSACEAIAAYGEQRGEVELLLTDVILPGETGRVLAGMLRRNNPKLKVLLVTGYAEQMRLGESEGCLAKPYTSGALLRRVRQALDHGELWTENEKAENEEQDQNAFKRACGNA
jgi:two-component system, cell cycle sensor histidine kinase and response regulator CckA